MRILMMLLLLQSLVLHEPDHAFAMPTSPLPLKSNPTRFVPGRPFPAKKRRSTSETNMGSSFMNMENLEQLSFPDGAAQNKQNVECINNLECILNMKLKPPQIPSLFGRRRRNPQLQIKTVVIVCARLDSLLVISPNLQKRRDGLGCR